MNLLLHVTEFSTDWVDCKLLYEIVDLQFDVTTIDTMQTLWTCVTLPVSSVVSLFFLLTAARYLLERRLMGYDTIWGFPQSN